MRMWFIWGAMSAIVVSSIASTPNGSVAIPSEVSEIRVKRVQEMSSDQDIRRLSQIQGRYRENLPLAKKKDSIRLHQSAPARKKTPAAKSPVKAPARKQAAPKRSAEQSKKAHQAKGLKITRLR